MSDKQEVIQADREAAAAYERFMLNDVNSYTRGIVNGRHDSHPLVQAFARHRLSTLEASDAASRSPVSDERAREVLRSVAGASEGLCNVSDALRAMHQYAAGLQGEVEALQHDNDRLRAALNSEVNDSTALEDTQTGGWGMSDKIVFNANDTVRVRLTDDGRAYHRQWHEGRYPMLKYSPPKEDEGGWSRWQLWVLMQEFGEGIYLGGKVPFETAIELEFPALRTQRDDVIEEAAKIADFHDTLPHLPGACGAAIRNLKSAHR